MEEIVVTGEMLDGFLRSKGVSNLCPACGDKNGMGISVNDAEGDLGANAPAVRLLRFLPDESGLGFGEFLQACGHCGYLRYFRDIEVLAFFEGGADNGG